MNKVKIIGAWLLASSALLAQTAANRRPDDPSNDDRYSPQQIERFHQMEGPLRGNIIFMEGVNFRELLDPVRPAEFDKRLDAALENAEWPADKAAELRRRLAENTFTSVTSNRRTIIDDIEPPPQTTSLPGTPGKPFAKDMFAIVMLPGDPDKKWDYDTKAWTNLTQIENPERPFPSAEETHAHVLGHESFHAGDPKTVTFQQKSAAGTLTARDVIAVEGPADAASAKQLLKIYKDPSYLEKLIHARAIEDIYLAGSYAPSPALLESVDRTKVTKSMVPMSEAREAEAHKKLTAYIYKAAGINPDGPGFTARNIADIGPVDMYGLLLQGLNARKISDPDAKKIARRFLEAYEYFEPSKAHGVREDISPPHRSSKPAATRVASHSQIPRP